MPRYFHKILGKVDAKTTKDLQHTLSEQIDVVHEARMNAVARATMWNNGLIELQKTATAISSDNPLTMEHINHLKASICV
mmetsp:Transcript_3784/g.11205  ORF Transcript_3784/g.11205 Transcript_3784/m.11205 type:complete len:80 (-) Transcript_3784:1094-1333(-)|eukprot:CAMPEP_0119283078 /NCGR_PEP_ID=MMETSP1329-20130426/27840_1 /TAXON_ID=114041 /ORGANISM="Genus nov. species nov., Strain RCC1024" /LENGTH=79 /DNA_ID=CAMNT_0007283743 /DNA_START=70 /DNA_END=309 /DNA_ORIENTATION=-